MCDTRVSPVHPDTSSSYLRKIKKPLIERKRRERINNCLTQLKTILLDNIKHNGGTQVSKLDKADILEMTVSHLRQIHHQQLSVAMAASASVVQQYREGFSECANETLHYMETTQAYPVEMVARARSNLTQKVNYIHGLNQYSRTVPNDLSSERTPIKIKIESPRPCRSVSPINNVTSTFSPQTLLIPVTQVKQERCSTYSGGHSLNSVSKPEQCMSSQSSVLALPSRVPVPVSVGDSPSQKQVWRPF